MAWQVWNTFSNLVTTSGKCNLDAIPERHIGHLARSSGCSREVSQMTTDVNQVKETSEPSEISGVVMVVSIMALLLLLVLLVA